MTATSFSEERLRAAFAQRHTRAYGRLRACGPCPHGDPFCPCLDGDVCHYTATDETPAMRCPRTGIVGCVECV